MQFDFAEVSFRVRYGGPQIMSLRKYRVNLFRRTPLKAKRKVIIQVLRAGGLHFFPIPVLPFHDHTMLR